MTHWHLELERLAHEVAALSLPETDAQRLLKRIASVRDSVLDDETIHRAHPVDDAISHLLSVSVPDVRVASRGNV